MSSLCNKIDCTDQIKKKQQTLKVKQHLPTTIKETAELLKDTQKRYGSCGTIHYAADCYD